MAELPTAAGHEILSYRYQICLNLIDRSLITENVFPLVHSGGAYGLARLSLGLYAGFVIGCCEALEFVSLQEIFTSVAYSCLFLIEIILVCVTTFSVMFFFFFCKTY
jgi:hypothetical protein